MVERRCGGVAMGGSVGTYDGLGHDALDLGSHGA